MTPMYGSIMNCVVVIETSYRLFPGTGYSNFTICIKIGCVYKSFQWPFSTWPEQVEGSLLCISNRFISFIDT